MYSEQHLNTLLEKHNKSCFFYKHTQCVKLVICSISRANLLYRSQWNQLVAILQIWNLQRGKRMHKFYLLLYHFRMYKLKHFDGQIIVMLTYHAGFYYIPINNLFTIQAHEYNKPDWKFRRSSVRSVSICVRERPRTFGNLANHSLPISEGSRSFANKTAYWTHCLLPPCVTD